MDRMLEARHLAQAEDAIALAEKRISRFRTLIAKHRAAAFPPKFQSTRSRS
jgi:hypothetical protein